MDTGTIDRLTETLLATADRVGYTLAEATVFGSGARGDHRPDSDVDVLPVSRDFARMAAYERPTLFFRHWDYDTPPDPEFIWLTPAGFEAWKAKRPHIVHTAVDEGVSVA